MIYLNEFDPHAAEWLRELSREGLIPEAHVDDRSIKDVQGKDLKGFDQCHFFAGIGGWPLALRLAGWPDSLPVWTGSCPCQPYSAAGKGKGDADERNLWPEFFRLIRECRPQYVFGEQVESAVGHGWLDGISADLEGEGYTVGAAVLGAHSVGAPHIRQRLYWVAHTSGTTGGLAHTGPSSPRHISGPVGNDATEWEQEATELARRGGVGGLGDTERPRLERLGGHVNNGSQSRRLDSLAGGHAAQASPVGAWDRFDLIPCRDGRTRRVESGTFPLAHGIPGRVGLLRGYGNAIVPQVAAVFIRAFMESVGIDPRGVTE